MECLLNFRPASAVSLDELAAAFNAGFAGYFYPMQITAELLARRVRMEHIDLQSSLLVDAGEKFVGLALLGLRGRVGWCGGFGIAQEFRGRGLAHRVMAEFIARARNCGVRKLRLEVLTRNTPAIRLYERAGMRITRDLLILERKRDSLERATNHARELKEAEPEDLLRHFERLHGWPMAWQRDYASLLSADGLHGVCLGERNAPGAYALLVARPDGITQVIDLGAADEEQADMLSAGIAHRCGALRVVNEPEESLFIAALMAHGFTEQERQHEMVCEL